MGPCLGILGNIGFSDVQHRLTSGRQAVRAMSGHIGSHVHPQGQGSKPISGHIGSHVRPKGQGFQADVARHRVLCFRGLHRIARPSKPMSADIGSHAHQKGWGSKPMSADIGSYVSRY